MLVRACSCELVRACSSEKDEIKRNDGVLHAALVAGEHAARRPRELVAERVGGRVGRGQPTVWGGRVRHAVDGPPPVVRLVVAHGARARLVGAAAELRAFVGARALAAAGDQIARRERIPSVRD